jgi:hypothetical protein
MGIVVLAILSVLALGTTMLSPAMAMRPFDRCVSQCMERGCYRYNQEGQRCMLQRRPGCVRECQQKRW